MSAEFEEFRKLGRAEKIQLVEDLWDNIAAEGEQEPLSAEKIEELRRRKERFMRHPESGLSWDEVKKHARSTRS